MTKFASETEFGKTVNLLAWPVGTATLTTVASPTMAVNVLALLEAAAKSEVQTQLQTLAAKINELVGIINASKLT